MTQSIQDLNNILFQSYKTPKKQSLDNSYIKLQFNGNNDDEVKYPNKKKLDGEDVIQDLKSDNKEIFVILVNNKIVCYFENLKNLKKQLENITNSLINKLLYDGYNNPYLKYINNNEYHIITSNSNYLYFYNKIEFFIKIKKVLRYDYHN